MFLFQLRPDFKLRGQQLITDKLFSEQGISDQKQFSQQSQSRDACIFIRNVVGGSRPNEGGSQPHGDQKCSAPKAPKILEKK